MYGLPRMYSEDISSSGNPPDDVLYVLSNLCTGTPSAKAVFTGRFGTPAETPVPFGDTKVAFAQPGPDGDFATPDDEVIMVDISTSKVDSFTTGKLSGAPTLSGGRSTWGTAVSDSTIVFAAPGPNGVFNPMDEPGGVTNDDGLIKLTLTPKGPSISFINNGFVANWKGNQMAKPTRCGSTILLNPSGNFFVRIKDIDSENPDFTLLGYAKAPSEYEGKPVCVNDSTAVVLGTQSHGVLVMSDLNTSAPKFTAILNPSEAARPATPSDKTLIKRMSDDAVALAAVSDNAIWVVTGLKTKDPSVARLPSSTGTIMSAVEAVNETTAVVKTGANTLDIVSIKGPEPTITAYNLPPSVGEMDRRGLPTRLDNNSVIMISKVGDLIKVKDLDKPSPTASVIPAAGSVATAHPVVLSDDLVLVNRAVKFGAGAALVFEATTTGSAKKEEDKKAGGVEKEDEQILVIKAQ